MPITLDKIVMVTGVGSALVGGYLMFNGIYDVYKLQHVGFERSLQYPQLQQIATLKEAFNQVCDAQEQLPPYGLNMQNAIGSCRNATATLDATTFGPDTDVHTIRAGLEQTCAQYTAPSGAAALLAGLKQGAFSITEQRDFLQAQVPDAILDEKARTREFARSEMLGGAFCFVCGLSLSLVMHVLYGNHA